MDDKHIKAVHDDDLVSLLSSLGVYEQIKSNSCRCHFCRQIISLDNLGAIIPLDGSIVFSCNVEKCLQQMIKVGDVSDCQ